MAKMNEDLLGKGDVPYPGNVWETVNPPPGLKLCIVAYFGRTGTMGMTYVKGA